jgi:prophage maintenance system killer protein
MHSIWDAIIIGGTISVGISMRTERRAYWWVYALAAAAWMALVTNDALPNGNMKTAVSGVWTFALGAAVLKVRKLKAEQKSREPADAFDHINKDRRITRQRVRQLDEAIALASTREAERHHHLKAQMSPHFLFNLLAGLQTSIELGETERAANVFNRLRLTLRTGLLKAQEPIGSVREELEHLGSYVLLERYRLHRPLMIEVYSMVKPDVPCPHFMLQPMVENAIWHGHQGLLHPGHWIRVEIFSPRPGELCLKVEDNGVGLNSKSPTGTLHRSRGTEIVKERIRLIAPQGQYTLETRQSFGRPGRGAVATISLHPWPVKIHDVLEEADKFPMDEEI